MFDGIYQYLFSADVMEYKTKKGRLVLLRVGDRVSVYSTRFSQWFDDGIIIATFRSSIKVRYGFQRYFGSAWSRGNEKYIKIGGMEKFVRPHTTTSSSDRLRLVCPAAAASSTPAPVPRGKLHSKAIVGVVDTITS